MTSPSVLGYLLLGERLQGEVGGERLARLGLDLLLGALVAHQGAPR